MQNYSMTQGHKDLSTLIHQMEETGTPIELTQSGKPVAVLVPKSDYDELTKQNLSSWDSLMAFRKEVDIDSLNIDPEIFNERRAQENG